ncbi:NADH:flavin oxidoreductase/NADH oxidase [Halostagnicola sp. A-GB9-2]|uniref:NADH:flavin oxidoreductase/NADH oxidase n=1 Tax=Halostagnicola sp. A-GB9-2 TaxID=3048066 RepID=UPI0024C077BA|nr:NADH:flavin oxidoreductase/NADH oxidase [Halostagnicola sp. A-GB9-2]MDJ1433262.1 NADH:flavin oxidoreductase/NADH oxidase [Halostagnicola sp. A-GB9-2]
MSHLFTSLSLDDYEIPNRLAVSPMCQYSCDPDGLSTEWHRVHLGSRAVGGAGIVITEATAVEPRGRITPHDLGIWSDEHADALAPTIEFIRKQGSVPAIQLAHAGHKSSKSRPWEGNDPIQPEEGGWEVLSPSPEAYPDFGGKPPAMRKADLDDVDAVIEAYRDAATRSLEAGFEIAEVHAAHGYLLHEFLSPVTNRREDEYGGSFENRTRLLREVTRAVRDVWPDEKPVFVRISGTDWLADRNSWDIDDSVRLAGDLENIGVDLLDVSSGGIHPDQEVPGGPNFQVPLAEQIRSARTTEIAVGAVGGITEPEQADAVIRNGRADLALVGREFLRDPYFGTHAADELGIEDAETKWPVQYRRAVSRSSE